jgi:hypothetical protein
MSTKYRVGATVDSSCAHHDSGEWGEDDPTAASTDPIDPCKAGSEQLPDVAFGKSSISALQLG